MVLIKKKKKSVDLGTLKPVKFVLQSDPKTIKVSLKSSFDSMEL